MLYTLQERQLAPTLERPWKVLECSICIKIILQNSMAMYEGTFWNISYFLPTYCRVLEVIILCVRSFYQFVRNLIMYGL